MSLIPKIYRPTETEDRKQIIVKDATGVYAAGTNPGGFGAPNTAIGDITAATLTLAKRNDDGSFTDAPIPTVDVFPTLPNVLGTPKYLSAFDYRYGPTSDAVFIDGIYRGIYTVVSGVGPETFVSSPIYFVLDQGICCCYKKKVAKIVATRCNVDLLEQKDRDIAMFWRFLQASKCCSNLNEIQNYIDILTKLCCGCGCGGGC